MQTFVVLFKNVETGEIQEHVFTKQGLVDLYQDAHTRGSLDAGGVITRLGNWAVEKVAALRSESDGAPRAYGRTSAFIRR